MVAEVINLPWPSRDLHPNARKDRRFATNTRQAAREAGYFLAKQFINSGGVPTDHLVLTFCPPDNRRRDLDRAFSACKSALDGISQALGRDDQHWTFTLLRGPIGRKGGHVEIMFQVVPGVLPVTGWVS